MDTRNVEKLNSPSDFMTTHLSGMTSASSPLTLLTPSHFTPTVTSTSTPTLTSVTSMTPVCPSVPLPHGADPWALQRLHPTQSSHTPLREEMEELRRKVERSMEELRERDTIISRQCTEREDLCAELKQSTQKRLQKEKEALCLSVDLLNVRVKSANDILTLQERELEEQCDYLHKDRSFKLLSLWREKVFMLLIQLRSKDSQLYNENTQLQHMVSDLQQEVQKLQSHIALLQHNLQDKTAQLQLHNIHTQELQDQLCSAVEENERLKKDKESNEKSTTQITDTVHRMSVCVREWESRIEAAQCHMSALTQRLNFANARLHTVQVLLMRREALWKVQQAVNPTEPPPSDSCLERLQSQVSLLSSERDTLNQELKRTPQLISNALRDLQLQLDRSREELVVCEIRCVEAHTQCEEQERTIAELRAETHHTQSVLQEKLSEVESLCAMKLREMESQLNTARREHTKAVVALRQVERTAERERQQEREVDQVRSEHTQTRITQLHTQLKEKDRDCNILLAVVQQQGLMNEYKKMRRAAIQTSAALVDKQQNKHQQQSGDTRYQEGSVLSVLCELRSLSSALIHSTDEEDEDNEEDEDTIKDKETPPHTQKH
ncbi:coiled-coil alpha-helical rod protein 1 isoform X5 [Hemibagrus wyckioides]|uniref:coiled-coil alpha-helical rod protein 1 isoform X5 n=1 Tax=Hemibagrus wyckioides TaxID=337641 RepID=UPI00266BEBB5|nr:coiled-coil alpha-helical rod protein 1 isoform X5 [Hemibagrus wyckioides]